MSHAHLLLGLLLSASCFAPIPVVSAPAPAYTAPPRPTPAPPPQQTPPPKEAIDSVAAPPPKATPPKPQDALDNITFSQGVTWSIAGNTPIASWSPSKNQISIISDHAQDPGAPKNHKRYVEIISGGKIKTVGSIVASSSPVVWLNEETLLFSCSNHSCGAGKDGAYLFDLKTATTTPLMLVKERAYVYAYALSNGNVLMNSEYELKSKYVVRWEEWSAVTKKVTLREDRAAYALLSKHEPQQNYCQNSIDQLFSFIKGGSITLQNNVTRQQKIVATINKSPTRGNVTCFAPQADGLLYFSFNEAEKVMQATLLQMSGYTRPEPPKPPAPPEKDVIYDLAFTEVFSWSIAGNTPIAAWSPERTQLAFFSDLPRKGEIRDGKKHLEVADLKTGKIKKLATIAPNNSRPLWLNERSLVFACSSGRCGKDQDGVYIAKIDKGAPTRIMPLKANSYTSLFVLSGGKLVISAQEYEEYSGSGPYPQPSTTWKEWDASTEKFTDRQEFPKPYETPSGALNPRACRENTDNNIGTFASEGKMGLFNYNTSARRVAVEATAFPYYQDDPDGVAPCLSDEVDFMIYYSRDQKAKQNKATLMKISGYTKSAVK